MADSIKAWGINRGVNYRTSEVMELSRIILARSIPPIKLSIKIEWNAVSVTRNFINTYYTNWRQTLLAVCLCPNAICFLPYTKKASNFYGTLQHSLNKKGAHKCRWNRPFISDHGCSCLDLQKAFKWSKVIKKNDWQMKYFSRHFFCII